VNKNTYYEPKEVILTETHYEHIRQHAVKISKEYTKRMGMLTHCFSGTNVMKWGIFHPLTFMHFNQ